MIKKRLSVSIDPDTPLGANVIDLEAQSELTSIVHEVSITQGPDGGYLHLKIPLMFVELAPAAAKEAPDRGAVSARRTNGRIV